MRAILLSLLVLTLAEVRAKEPDPATLRARAALALAFSGRSPTYAEAYTTAIEAKKPLVVFVGQPMREVPGCVCIGLGSFPGVKAEGVVIGLPSREGLQRVDLTGKPSTEVLLSAVATPTRIGAKVLPGGQ